MTRYISLRRPRFEDDYYHDTPQTMQVIVEDSEPVETGLEDHLGIPIMRVPDKIPMGFKK